MLGGLGASYSLHRLRPAATGKKKKDTIHHLSDGWRHNVFMPYKNSFILPGDREKSEYPRENLFDVPLFLSSLTPQGTREYISLLPLPTAPRCPLTDRVRKTPTLCVPLNLFPANRERSWSLPICPTPHTTTTPLVDLLLIPIGLERKGLPVKKNDGCVEVGKREKRLIMKNVKKDSGVVVVVVERVYNGGMDDSANGLLLVRGHRR